MPALLAADGRRPLTFSRLEEEARRTARRLRAAGILRGSRIAIALPNGPDLAVCLLGAFLAGECAPLNPAYSEREFEFYLGDLGAQVLIVPAGADMSARKAAQRLGVHVLETAASQNAEAGVFEFCESLAEGRDFVDPTADDIALALHTSGTTSRPKLVPLTHRNICRSAANIGRWFELTPADRCLQVMPLFHVHGMIGALLSSIAAGASVVCTPGFDADRFGGWVDEFRTTWYTAVPTIHQAVLARADVRKHWFRFIRSCSSPLPSTIMSALEARFGVPVVESYGMTEGAHQIASNPLPPAARKPGSVGKATGTRIAILNDAGTALPLKQLGEVAIQGPNVTSGYAANPDAGCAAFHGRWFRTGDRGYLDEDGYLFLVGRIKELINRGGEKIAPREIDEVLLEHPDVAEAIAFAIPDAALGEDVGAAVVLKPGAGIGSSELREHAAARLAYYKIPRQFVLLDRIPKGPTGKPQRIGLAAKLDISASCRLPQEPPQGRSEELVSHIWCDVLHVPSVGRHDNFFDLGGDSLRGAQVIARLREANGTELRISDLFAWPTVAELSRKVLPDREPGSTGALIRKPRVGAERTLSYAQEGMWFLEQLTGDYATALRPFLFRATGALHPAALELAIRHVMERHEALRTRIGDDDGNLQGLLSPSEDFHLHTFQARSIPSAERMATRFIRKPFDLAQDLPLRAALFEEKPGHSLLAICMHHSCSDGFSNAIFMRELSAAYKAFVDGTEPELPAVPLQYADYAEWQRSRLQGVVLREALAYWSRRLQGAPANVRLPFDCPRTATREHHGGLCERLLDAAGWADVRGAARRSSVTPYIVLLAALFRTLYELSGETDIVVGSPAANRPSSEAELVIGLFTNPIVLRCNLAGAEDGDHLLRRVRDAAVEALEHQDVPIEKLVSALPRRCDRGFEPLYRVSFQLRNVPLETLELPGTTLEDVPVHIERSLLDLQLEAIEEGPALRLRLAYHAGLFRRETAERMLSQYLGAVERLAREPGRTVSGASV
jgi:acyl-CoA synthetase (AMP-forming)/AMP-acid ligase II/acyl carrier protein